jgi:hypothetical protein
MRLLLLAAVLALFPLAAGAADFCLQRTQSLEFQPRLGNRSVIVTDRAQRKFIVSFGGPCKALDDAGQLGFQTMEQSRLACIDKGDYLVSRRGVEGGTFGRSCGVQNVTPYTAEMQNADAVKKAMDLRY